MALYDAVGGPGGSPPVLISRSGDPQTRTEYPYYKDGVEGTVEITELVRSTTNRYYALTKAACLQRAGELDNASLFPVEGVQTSYKIDASDHRLGSYIMEITTTYRSEKITGFTEGPPEEESR
jgi:hypothetical protein